MQRKSIIDGGAAELDGKAHLLPCTIEFNGPAPVHEYFVTTTDDRECLLARFRGIELLGKELPVPANFTAVVGTLEEDKYVIREKFSSITYWNRELVPSDRDRVPLWFQWPELAYIVSSLFFWFLVHCTLTCYQQIHTDNKE
jgi:hypothetical protein